jgi:hypothetical protein
MLIGRCVVGLSLQVFHNYSLLAEIRIVLT